HLADIERCKASGISCSIAKPDLSNTFFELRTESTRMNNERIKQSQIDQCEQVILVGAEAISKYHQYVPVVNKLKLKGYHAGIESVSAKLRDCLAEIYEEDGSLPHMSQKVYLAWILSHTAVQVHSAQDLVDTVHEKNIKRQEESKQKEKEEKKKREQETPYHSQFEMNNYPPKLQKLMTPTSQQQQYGGGGNNMDDDDSISTISQQRYNGNNNNEAEEIIRNTRIPKQYQMNMNEQQYQTMITNPPDLPNLSIPTTTTPFTSMPITPTIREPVNVNQVNNAVQHSQIANKYLSTSVPVLPSPLSHQQQQSDNNNNFTTLTGVPISSSSPRTPRQLRGRSASPKTPKSVLDLSFGGGQQKKKKRIDLSSSSTSDMITMNNNNNGDDSSMTISGDDLSSTLTNEPILRISSDKLAMLEHTNK
ncbi:MAG: hypothetical protein AABY22_28735, partial [Nanoarchaeota archaeon]